MKKLWPLCCLPWLGLLPLAPAAPGEPLEVTQVRAVYRHGQTFVTWKDVAEGEAGAKYRYSLYRSDRPITADNLTQAELCYRGVFNNSPRLFGPPCTMKNRSAAPQPTAPRKEGAGP